MFRRDRGANQRVGRSVWTLLAVCLAASGCGAGFLPGNAGRLADTGPFAPGADPKGAAVDGVTVGNRLMAAGEHELALQAFTRAALDQGMTAEIMGGLGTANLGLGRLGQAEPLLRRTVEMEPDWPEAWNNLGVLLMERGATGEAALTLRKAYALDSGRTDSIRENLRLALAKRDASDKTAAETAGYILMRQGSSQYRISRAP